MILPCHHDTHLLCIYTTPLRACVSACLRACVPCPSSEMVAQGVFKKYDADQSGAIDSRELRQMLQDMNLKVSEEDTAELIAQFDDNGDGVIQVEEWMTLAQVPQILPPSAVVSPRVVPVVPCGPVPSNPGKAGIRT